MENLFFLLISLVLILFSCILFSNSIEWLGSKLNLSHGVTGSILAAVGTALPETIVPLVAIFGGISKKELIDILLHGAKSDSPLNQISIGAIIGAPFMLSTLAMFLIGVSTFIYFKSGRRITNHVLVDEVFLRRDLKFFILSFLLALVGTFLSHFYRVIIAILLLVIYGIYINITLKTKTSNESSYEKLEHEIDPLYFSKIMPVFGTNMTTIVIQLIFSLVFLVFSAHHFVHAIKEISFSLHAPAFLISLLLTPIATELPEKFNSWMWIRSNKDTLAVGNISGAMVFQSTFPVSIGLLFTSWCPKDCNGMFLQIYYIFISCFVCSLILLFFLKNQKLSYKTFLSCGLFYLIYVLILVFTRPV